MVYIPWEKMFNNNRGHTMSLFETGIRPAIDAYLLKKAQERRDYGGYWSASSAGYCMRKVIFDRLKVPKVKDDARKTRVFESGHIFHEWIQRITKGAGWSIAQETELQDEELMIRGHIDDLILIEGDLPVGSRVFVPEGTDEPEAVKRARQHLILYDYKTQNSRAFSYQKDRPMSHFHKMQLGTYMYMIRKGHIGGTLSDEDERRYKLTSNLSDARILKISKDDLRMDEQQLLWSSELEREVVQYWTTLARYLEQKKLPRCTCGDHEGGFMAREAYNDYWFDGEPCSIKWLLRCMKEKKVEATGWTAENV
jgi:hypothetical protein